MPNLRFLALLCTVVGVCRAGLVGSREKPSELESNNAAQDLFKRYFQWRISDMPEYATFIGVNDYDTYLDDLSEKAFKNRTLICSKFLKEAESLRDESDHLTDDNKINLDVLIYELETFITGYDFKGFYLPVNRLEGPQYDMERLFAWMKKENIEDYGKMLVRMVRVETQLVQVKELLAKGLEEGIVYPWESINNLMESFKKIIQTPKESPFYRFFTEDLPSNLTPDQIWRMQLLARHLIATKINSGYYELIKFINTTYTPRKEIGVTTIKGGDEFYKQLIRYHTSTNLTAKEIHQIGLDEVARIKQKMKEIIDSMGYPNMTVSQFSQMIRNDPNNFYDSAEELLEGYRHIANDLIIPRLSKIFKNIPKAELKIVGNPDPDAPGAFYLTGSFNGSRPGVFYVNTYDVKSQSKYSMMTLSLHEGNPGHHLQTSYSIESPSFPDFRKTTDDRNYGTSPSKFPIYTYYIEGWALYSEALGFDLGLYEDPLDRYGHYSAEMLRACRLVVDTGIHALGWSRQQAIDYILANTADTRHDTENEVDRYITWPGQALAYKMGELRFTELHKKAKEALGESFDLREFHDIVLGAAGPMDIVEQAVNKWIGMSRK